MEIEKHTPEAGIEPIDRLIEMSSVVMPAGQVSIELKEMAGERKGTLTYHDSKNINWNVNGYDFVFFDELGNLRHTKFIPSEFGIAEGVHEREKVEQILSSKGFILDESEKFRSAIYRQLNN